MNQKALFKKLKNLPSNFMTVEMQNHPSISSDFLITVGSTGIFMLKSQNLDGPISYDGKMLARWKIPFPENILRKSELMAIKLKNYLNQAMGVEYPINPILVFSDFKTYLPPNLEKVEEVFLLQKKNVINFITKRNSILRESEIEEIKKFICR